MAKQVVMPQMGESVAEGTIVRWLKKVGDAVERDEPLFEISTDKVDAEIPSPSAGVLSEIKVREGETVPINTVVGVVDETQAGKAPSKPAAPPPAAAKVRPDGIEVRRRTRLRALFANRFRLRTRCYGGQDGGQAQRTRLRAVFANRCRLRTRCYGGQDGGQAQRTQTVVGG